MVIRPVYLRFPLHASVHYFFGQLQMGGVGGGTLANNPIHNRTSVAKPEVSEGKTRKAQTRRCQQPWIIALGNHAVYAVWTLYERFFFF